MAGRHSVVLSLITTHISRLQGRKWKNALQLMCQERFMVRTRSVSCDSLMGVRLSWRDATPTDCQHEERWSWQDFRVVFSRDYSRTCNTVFRSLMYCRFIMLRKESFFCEFMMCRCPHWGMKRFHLAVISVFWEDAMDEMAAGALWSLWCHNSRMLVGTCTWHKLRDGVHNSGRRL